jgi:hypothetical protein
MVNRNLTQMLSLEQRNYGFTLEEKEDGIHLMLNGNPVRTFSGNPSIDFVRYTAQQKLDSELCGVSFEKQTDGKA